MRNRAMMIATKYSIKEIKDMVRSLVEKYSADGAVIFGSYARGDATEDSDIDVMIIGGQHFDPTDVFCIADELYDIAGKQVDVYEEREIDRNSEFFRNILKDGVKV